MQLVIFGASGKVGRLAVAEALERGHYVRAFVHRNNRLKPHSRLHVVQGDIHDRKAVLGALDGCQAVICTLGSWHSKEKDIVSSGMRSIIPAMQAIGLERIISLTGADARDSTDRPDLLGRSSRLTLGIIAGKIIADGEQHIRLLRASGLEWTVLRSPVMTNGAEIFYKLSLQPQRPWRTITRRAVAKALLDQLDGPAYAREAPYLYRR